MNFSVVGPKRECAKALKLVSGMKEYSYISNVKLQRISFRVWHIQFDATRV